MSNRNYDLDLTGKKQGHVVVKRTAKSDGSCLLTIKLHNNEVFRADYGLRSISFSACGWYTAATRDVINTALREFRPDMRVYRQNYVWRVDFANGEEQSALEACENKKYGF